MLEFVQTVNGYLADYILIILLIGTGVYFTVRTRLVQIRCFGEGMKKVFGKLNVQYLFNNNKTALLIYSVAAIAFIFLGSLLSNDLVWELTDFFNYLMVLPNAIALIALSSLVVTSAKEGEDAWR